MDEKCPTCDGCEWVCEDHPDVPWEGERACGCGGAGMPCPDCNPLAKTEEPDA